MKSALHPWTPPKGPHNETPPKESGVQYLLDRKMVITKNKIKKDIVFQFGKVDWEEQRRRDSLFVYFTFKHDWVRHWIMLDPTGGIKVAIGLKKGRSTVSVSSAEGYSDSLKTLIVTNLIDRKVELVEHHESIIKEIDPSGIYR